jgi:hypothetical protein
VVWGIPLSAPGDRPGKIADREGEQPNSRGNKPKKEESCPPEPSKNSPYCTSFTAPPFGTALAFCGGERRARAAPTLRSVPSLRAGTFLIHIQGHSPAPYVPSGRLPIGMDLSAAIRRHGVIRRMHIHSLCGETHSAVVFPRGKGLWGLFVAPKSPLPALHLLFRASKAAYALCRRHPWRLSLPLVGGGKAFGFLPFTGEKTQGAARGRPGSVPIFAIRGFLCLLSFKSGITHRRSPASPQSPSAASHGL